MLVFAAADEDAVQTLIDETRRYLAWVSVQKDAAALNLDRAQERQVKESIEKGERTIGAQLDAAYHWALSPRQEGTGPLEWETILLRDNDLGSTGGLVQRASYRFQSQELLITSWSPIHLRRELDKYLWKEGQPHIAVKQLWEYLATYPYLPRLRDKEVLLATIRAGVVTRDFFGYATGVKEKGEYVGLAFGKQAPAVYYDDVSIVIRPEIAGEQKKAQGEIDTAAAVAGTGAVQVTTLGDTGKSVKAAKRFYGTIRLPPLRFTHEAGVICQEVIQHLEALLDTNVKVTLEITAENTQGFPPDVIRIVTENAKIFSVIWYWLFLL